MAQQNNTMQMNVTYKRVRRWRAKSAAAAQRSEVKAKRLILNVKFSIQKMVIAISEV